MLFGKPFPVDTIFFRLTCGFIHISLCASADSPSDRPCWLFILNSSPHVTAKETKWFTFPLTLRGFLLAENRNLMSSKRMDLKHTISKKSENQRQSEWDVPHWKREMHSLGFLIVPQGCLRAWTFQGFSLIWHHSVAIRCTAAYMLDRITWGV